MLNKGLSFVSILMTVLLTSCIKDVDGPLDITVSTYPEVELNLDQPNAYKNKVYYSMATNSIVKTSNSLDWHIAFSSDPNLVDSKAILNYGLGRSCWGFTNRDTNWSRAISTSAFQTAEPIYANQYDSFANLFLNGTLNVYYLNFGAEYPNVKFQITSFTPTEVKFRYANLDGTNEKSITIALNPNTYYTYYSFSDNQIKNIEPVGKTTWDFEVTRYTTFVYDFNDPQMYEVGGFISNPGKGIEVAKLEETNLEDISTSTLGNQIYSTKLTAIGHDWKKFTSNNANGYYKILGRSYIVRVDGKSYGIQFKSYSKQQVNGYPTFHYREF